MTHLTIQGRSLTAMEWGNRILLLMLTTFFVSGVSHSFLTDTLDPIGFLLRILLVVATASIIIYILIMIFKEYKYTLYTLVIRGEKLKNIIKNRFYILWRKMLSKWLIFSTSQRRDIK